VPSAAATTWVWAAAALASSPVSRICLAALETDLGVHGDSAVLLAPKVFLSEGSTVAAPRSAGSDVEPAGKAQKEVPEAAHSLESSRWSG
jgi:hypothetical protein